MPQAHLDMVHFHTHLVGYRFSGLSLGTLVKLEKKKEKKLSVAPHQQQ